MKLINGRQRQAARARPQISCSWLSDNYLTLYGGPATERVHPAGQEMRKLQARSWAFKVLVSENLMKIKCSVRYVTVTPPHDHIIIITYMNMNILINSFVTKWFSIYKGIQINNICIFSTQEVLIFF